MCKMSKEDLKGIDKYLTKKIIKKLRIVFSLYFLSGYICIFFSTASFSFFSRTFYERYDFLFISISLFTIGCYFIFESIKIFVRLNKEKTYLKK